MVPVGEKVVGLPVAVGEGVDAPESAALGVALLPSEALTAPLGEAVLLGVPEGV